MTTDLRPAEVKKLAAILRRVNWPLDGRGRYGSIPASQVNDAASRLYSAGVRAATKSSASEGTPAPVSPEPPPTWTTTRELRIDSGPVVVAQTRSDPGDMGEPRLFESEGVTYLSVPDFDFWPVEDAAPPPATPSLDATPDGEIEEPSLEQGDILALPRRHELHVYRDSNGAWWAKITELGSRAVLARASGDTFDEAVGTALARLTAASGSSSLTGVRPASSEEGTRLP